MANSLCFVNNDNLAAVIFAAVGTNAMRALHFATVRAGDKVKQLQRIMRAALVATRLRYFMLWYSTHNNNLSMKYFRQQKISGFRRE
jgi:hypothetical protein